MTRHVRNRRGVLLLVVLSLLVLFAAIAVAFVVSSNQYRIGSKYEARAEQQADDYRDSLDAAAMHVFRGPASQLPSANTPVAQAQDPWTPGIKSHSLLEDMLGQDSFIGTISAISTLGGNQFVTFTVAPIETFTDSNSNGRYDAPEPWVDTNNDKSFTAGTDLLLDLDGDNNFTPGESFVDQNGNGRFDGIPYASGGVYSGCLLTMVSGEGRGHTSRIVGYGYTAPNATVTVLAFADLPSTATLKNNDQCLITGRPFNGTGPGFNVATGRLNLTFNLGVGTYPLALLPNAPAKFHVREGVGGANEDFDAPDFQNMLLGVPHATNLLPIIPSLHRQHLLNFVYQDLLKSSNRMYASSQASGTVANLQFPYGADRIKGTGDDPSLANADQIVALRRFILMRPLPEDHPNFTGSNPDSITPGKNFELEGPWDVDNDGNGTRESIWVDFGLPVQTLPDGRRYKRLFAVLCTDLDGRLNFNAHGGGGELDGEPLYNANHLASNVTSPLPLGQGMGPADIRLKGLFQGPQGTDDYQRFLKGTDWNVAATTPPMMPWDGRNGEMGVQSSPDERRPGVSSDASNPTNADMIGRLKQYGYPSANAFLPKKSTPYDCFPDYLTMTPAQWGLYGSPPDFRGCSFLGIDKHGSPLMRAIPTMSNGNPVQEWINDPYELNLSRKVVRTVQSTASTDNLFSVSELERILRYYDLDAGTLPDRLRYLVDPDNLMATTPTLSETLRFGTTTDSFDVASPTFAPPWEMKHPQSGAPLPFASHLVDVLRFKGVPDVQIANLLPHDLLAGVKMDVNRPFGNGQDDGNTSNTAPTQNGIVDDPAEADITNPSISEKIYGVDFDYNNDGRADRGVSDGTFTSKDNLARQEYAKHLYVLMMLLKGPGYIDFDGNPNNDSLEETTRGLAQWSINVVDFRDRDSIMTPFEYVVDPFTSAGWPLDGIVGMDSADESNPLRRLVWGCERPELLITETLALHDRRIEDTDKETDMMSPQQAAKTDDPDAMKRDADFDQRLMPKGSFYVELYNPWTGSENTQSEFYYDRMSVHKYKQGTSLWKDGVLLDKLAPARSGENTAGVAVWRLLIVKGTGIGKDPDDPNLANRPTATEVERSVYFVGSARMIPKDPNDGFSYFYSLNSAGVNFRPAPILPGRYAVVGGYSGLKGSQVNVGSDTTFELPSPIGRRTDVPAFPPSIPTSDSASLKQSTTRQLILTPYWDPNVDQFDYRIDGATQLGVAIGDRQPVVAVPINVYSDPQDTPASASAKDRRLSISEPPFPDNAGGTYTVGSTYYPGFTGTESGDEGGEGAYTAPKDIPFDSDLSDGTTYAYREVHLQRLANPMLTWNPEPSDAVNHRTNLPVNPYKTIDSMTVDLTVFNGTTAESVDTKTGAKKDVNFGTLQRGEQPNVPYPLGNPLTHQVGVLWRHQASNPPHASNVAPTAPGVPSHNFTPPLQHTLGYLNKPFGTGLTGGAAPTHPYDTGTAKYYAGAPDPSMPTGCFPWLTWNNRPFIGPLELQLVPKSRSSQLLWDYHVPAAASTVNPFTSSKSTFNHLLNFYYTATGLHNNSSSPPGSNVPTCLYRVFDYLQVPSRFAGAEQYLAPQPINTDKATLLTKGVRLFAPFNHVSNHRDPGKININTITTSAVWEGFLAGRTTPTIQEIFASRQGLTGSMTSSDIPSPMMNPFRSASSADLTLPGFTGRDEIDVTFMRRNAAGVTRLFAPTPTGAVNDPTRHPYFDQQEVQRVSNLLTTHSNVYAVWITVGYFQVTPWGGYAAPNSGNMVFDAAHPDGYQLGEEVGTDTGNIQRHRAFYIFDRTLPVGFYRGQSLNVDKAILLKRYIE